MSKEQLGFDVEIEMKHLKEIVNKDDRLTITSRFVEYLIEQAERVQELEGSVDMHMRVAHRNIEQNRRYRGAIVMIKESTRQAHSGSECVDIIFDIIHELEDDLDG